MKIIAALVTASINKPVSTTIGLLILFMLSAMTVVAEQLPPPSATTEYSKEGADTCLQCHDQDSKFPVLAIFNSPHGNKNTKHGPFSSAGLQCETCHGAAAAHTVKRLRKGQVRAAMISFKTKDVISNDEKNQLCLACHQATTTRHWLGSVHQSNDLACTDCHQIHISDDPILNKAQQLEQCGQCHTKEKVANHSVFSHPLTSGQMGCTDCHSPHDANNNQLLVSDSVNETCYQCHAEKRGPFLWEHEPVTDNCLNCHRPHGSNQAALLTQRAPYLCQNCHNSDGHPSFSYGSDDAQGQQASAFLLGRSCANCHAKIHGSNHPSGYKFQR
ncbi:cystathionine beta-synthase [Thalassotalea insulae]|uniref:Cystathionine beta-synthase n=1 Tax=Thalassotalea insulae TaxID=2056778 RepID=A0ABQ6GUY8_9GAMM|nr:DmsE family decaheme c-type cytochrome [Thalassotalea insulae]GLX79499.1 cystathionine beta-synthase [Thalassotalea insulae]